MFNFVLLKILRVDVGYHDDLQIAIIAIIIIITIMAIIIVLGHGSVLPLNADVIIHVSIG